MKKIISLFLLLALILSLCACGAKESPAQQPEETEAPVVTELDVEELAAQATEIYFGSPANAFELLSEAQDFEAEYVQELLALCHYNGFGTEIDSDTALEMCATLAEGSVFAKIIYADAVNTGNGTVQNPVLAEELYAELIKSGAEADEDAVSSGMLYASLAECYAKGLGTEVDFDKAGDMINKAIANGNLSVFDMLALASLLENIDKSSEEKEETEFILDESSESLSPDSKRIRLVKELYTKARSGIEALAESGNTKAIKLLGDYYLKGYGSIQQDYAKAMEYYTLAADEDYADAQAQIAYMYMEGLGVDVDYVQAMEWNNRAAQQNNAQGQAQIGYMYHMGLGVTQNLNEAGRWYSRAVDQGDPWATGKLAETELTHSQAYFESHA